MMAFATGLWSGDVDEADTATEAMEEIWWKIKLSHKDHCH